MSTPLLSKIDFHNFGVKAGNQVTDALGYLYVCGQTTSTDILLVNGYDVGLGGTQDAFVAKISPNGNLLAFSSNLGGSDSETMPSIAVDTAGCMFVIGATASTNFPVVTPYDGSSNGIVSAFFTKICLPPYL